MEPTNAELIFYAVLGVIGLIFLICAMCTKDDTIEMTWTKKRDIARAERRWSK